jgi:hypothetical protein
MKLSSRGRAIRIRGVVVATIAVAMSAVWSGAAHAKSPCDGRALPEGPLPTGFEEADFGEVKSACPRSELGFGVDGRAIVDEAHFYGDIRGAGRFDVSVQPFPQLELFGSTELLEYHQVIQSFKASYLGLGDTSAGAVLLAFAHDDFALSVMGRADLPTAYGYYQNAFPVGLEAGLLGLIAPVEPIRLHGGLLAGTTFALTNASPDTRPAIVGNVGADVVLFDWLALVGDVNAQALEHGALDDLALGGGLRFDIVGVGAEIGAVVPVAGSEKNVASFILRGAWRF